MHYILEALFVGVYTCILYLVIPIRDTQTALFIIGFVKHYLGYWLNIHNYYCNNGYSCKGNYPSKYKLTQIELMLESSIEGMLFLLLGNILFILLNNKNKITVYFTIGVLLHLLFEWFGIHRNICVYRCKREESS